MYGLRIHPFFLATAALFACTRLDAPSTPVASEAAGPAPSTPVASEAAGPAPAAPEPTTPLADPATTPPQVPLTGETADIALLSAAELTRPWAKLALPQAGIPARVSRGPQGFLALAIDQINSGKAIVASHSHLYRSDDGIAWHRVELPVMADGYFVFSGVAYGAGRYVLIGSGGGQASTRIWTSTDLPRWSEIPPETLAPRVEVCHDLGNVVICITEGLDVRQVFRLQQRFFLLGTNDIFVSNDGLAWTRTHIPIIQPRGLAFGNGTFVAACALSLRTSSDGTGWEDHSSGGPYDRVVFLQDRFYADRLVSNDGLTWQAHTGPIAYDSVGGYLFVQGEPLAFGAEPRALNLWRPGEAVQTIAIEPPIPSTPLAGGAGPATITTPLPGGETCLTHRCVVVGGALFLIR